MKQINLSNFKEVPLVDTGKFPIKQNPQLYFFKLENESICAYSPLSNMAAVLKDKEYAYVKKNKIIYEKEQGNEELYKSFIYDSPAINTGYSKEGVISFKPKINESSIRQLSIILTTNCNLRCKYCFVFGGEGAVIEKEKSISGLKSEIDPEIAIYAINRFKPQRITLFGWGEPTMAFPVIKRIVSAIDTEKTKIDIVTNGVYLSKREEIVKYLVEHNIKIELSFDGLVEFQNANRPMANNSPSADEVIKTIDEIKKYGKLSDLATVRVTVCGGMEEKIQESINYLHGLGFDSIGIQPVEISGRAIKNVKSLDLELFAKNTARAIAESKKADMNVNSRILPSGDSWSTACYGCGFMAGYMLALGPDGKFYSCDDPLPIFEVGSITKKGKNYTIDLDYDKINEFADERYIVNLKNCETCPVKCGGGCAKESFDHYGLIDVGGESEEFCDAKREALAEYIKCATA